MGKFTAQRLFAFGALGAVAALAACGGGGGSSGVPPVARQTAAPVITAPPAGSGLAPASFAIKIPGPGNSSISRRTQAVNSATTTISFLLLKTDAAGVALPQTATPFDVSTGSPLCTAGTAGARSCTIGINAPIGNDIYSVATFDVHGNKLGSSAVTLKVLQNVANTASISLGGTIAGVVLSSLTILETSFQVLDITNGPASARIVVIGFDSQGNVILTPDTFSSPINLKLFGDPFTVPDINQLNNTRRTLAVSPIVQVGVAYANPGTGSATASTTDLGGPITVTSPGDVVTLTALSPAPQFQTAFLLLGAVGSLPVSIPSAPPTAAPGAVAATIGAIGVLVAAAPPTPPPAPAPFISFAANPSAGFRGSQPNQSYEFLSATAGGTLVTISDTTGASPTVGTISAAFTGASAALCANEIDTSMFPTNAPISLGGQVQFTLQTLAHNGSTPAPVGSPPPSPFPTGAITCTLTATDSHSSSALLTVTIDNITGTVPVQ